MPPLRTNYSKRRLPPAQLDEQIEDLTRILSPDVTLQFHKLQDAYGLVRTLRRRDACYLVLHEWNKHGNETKLNKFMTEKIAELGQRGNRHKKNNTDFGPQYRALATDFLRSNFQPEELAQILKCKARRNQVGSALFKKCDADILAKCPHVFDSVEGVVNWRSRGALQRIERLISRALPSELNQANHNQTLSSHSAGANNSALESLAHAAAFAAERDRYDAQSGEPQDAGGLNCGHQDMENGSPATAIAAPAPARREGGLPFTLQVRAWRLKPALSDGVTSAGYLDSTVTSAVRLECTSAAPGAADSVRFRGRRLGGCGEAEVAEDAAATSRTGGKPPTFPHFEDHPYFSSGPSAIELRLTGPLRAHVPLAAAGAGIDRGTGLDGGAGGDAGDRGAGEVGDAMGGAEDTDVWVESTVKEVSTCGSLFAGREGGLPFTLQVRAWRLKPALSDRVTSAGYVDSTSAGRLHCISAAPGAAETDDSCASGLVGRGRLVARDCRDGGSLVAAIAAPARREGELFFTLKVRGWRLKPALSDRITSAVLNCTFGAAEGTDMRWDEESRECLAADTPEGDLPSLLLGPTHLTASKLAGGRQRS